MTRRAVGIVSSDGHFGRLTRQHHAREYVGLFRVVALEEEFLGTVATAILEGAGYQKTSAVTSPGSGIIQNQRPDQMDGISPRMLPICNATCEKNVWKTAAVCVLLL